MASESLRLSGPGWHTDVSSGRPEIKTPNGTPFRIEAVNWYGFETADSVAHGLYAIDYQAMLTHIANAGFNTIRIRTVPVLPMRQRIRDAGGSAVMRPS